MWERAAGSIVQFSGSVFIDFTSGIFVANVGHSNDAVMDAIEITAGREGLHSYTYPTEVRAEYEARLCEWAGYESCHLFTTGSEAVEAALRLVREGSPYQLVWGIEGCFHGKTLGSRLLRPHGAWISLDEVRHGKRSRGKVAAVIVEGYRGWDALFWDEVVIEWLRDFQRIGKPVIFDEVQSGFGRTGRRFCYEHYGGIRPDILVVGKGQGSGFPISALLAQKDLVEPMRGEFSSTHGGSPLGCAAGLATIEEFERLDLVNEAARKGEIFHEALSSGISLPVRGRGMVAAILTDTVEQADRIVSDCRSRGLLVVHTGRASVKLGPPLVISDQDLLRGVQILKEVCGEVV